MFNTINHQYSKHTNETLNWFEMDSEKLYLSNLETQYWNLEKHNWINRNFTYKLNSHGFRCDEFTNDPSAMFLGCSQTVGIGLPLEHTWAYILSQKMNLKMVNLGIGGTGPDSAFRLANHYIPILKPKIVIYLQPDSSRLLLINRNNKFINLSVNNDKNLYSSFYFEWVMNEENLHLHSLRNLLAIESICNRNNIKLLTFTGQQFIRVDFARDLAHHGIQSNKEFSEFVWKHHEESKQSKRS
jgi:hypothetical protein